MKIYIVRSARGIWFDDEITDIVTTSPEEAIKVAYTVVNYIEPEKGITNEEWEEVAQEPHEHVRLDIWENGKKIFGENFYQGRKPFPNERQIEFTQIVQNN